jgi:hypothetical protein
MVEHTGNPSYSGAVAGLQGRGQPGQLSKTCLEEKNLERALKKKKISSRVLA